MNPETEAGLDWAVDDLRRSEIEMRRDVWLTAAAMTALMLPVGLFFGLAALLAARGSRHAIAQGAWELAERKLGFCRMLAIAGTVLGLGVALFQMSSLFDVWGRPRDAERVLTRPPESVPETDQDFEGHP